MKLSYIKIENFRCHKSTELQFSDHHVLVGENGSGKTAVLEAINYVTSPYYLSSRLDEQDFNSADAGDIKIIAEFDKPFAVKIPDGYTYQLILAKLVQLHVKRRDRAASGKVFSEPFVVSHLCIPITFEKKGDTDKLSLPDGVTADDLPGSVIATSEGFSIMRKSGNAMSTRRETISLSNELIGFPNVFYFDRQRERETKAGFNTLFNKIAKDLNWRYRKGWSKDETTKTWANYYDSVIGTVEDKKKRELLTPLREALTELVGEDFSSLEISLLNIEQPFSKGFFSFRQALNQVDLEGAGSGIAMLAALLLLEQVGKRSGDDLILLIDEPELHLHPQLQLKLTDHMQESVAQTIVTTHSPLFVDIGCWRSISRMTINQAYPKQDNLSKKLGPKTIAEHLDDISAFYYHETTFCSNDSEMFFARKVLLVEGPVEKYGLPRLARILEKELEQLTIVSCNGKDKIPHYVTICNAYEIPVMILFDLDGKDEEDYENAKVINASVGAKSHSFTTSFEQILGIGRNAEHKASKALSKIDGHKTKEAIPGEIREAVKAIADWCCSKKIGATKTN